MIIPFKYAMKPYTRERIEALNPNQDGVYGIFLSTDAVYIGSGDIRDRLLTHYNGDNPCITRNKPNQWTAEVMEGDPTAREGQLIREYDPICNKVVPR